MIVMPVHNALDEAFAIARREGRAALLPYLTGGMPDPDRFVDVAVAILEAGGDALEIGIPFSDPLLDGPVIQSTQQRALDAGITPARCLDFAAAINARAAQPLIFMTAYNPVLAYGLERFCRDARAAGIVGLIVTDVPLEEQAELRGAAGANQIHLIAFATPTSTPERLQALAGAASGFVYGASVAGVTGARDSVVATAEPMVRAVREVTDVPIAVGFGIAGPRQAAEVAAFADGVAVGTALVRLLDETPPEDRIEAAQRFIRELRDAARREVGDVSYVQ